MSERRYRPKIFKEQEDGPIYTRHLQDIEDVRAVDETDSDFTLPTNVFGGLLLFAAEFERDDPDYAADFAGELVDLRATTHQLLDLNSEVTRWFFEPAVVAQPNIKNWKSFKGQVPGGKGSSAAMIQALGQIHRQLTDDQFLRILHARQKYFAGQFPKVEAAVEQQLPALLAGIKRVINDKQLPISDEILQQRLDSLRITPADPMTLLSARHLKEDLVEITAAAGRWSFNKQEITVIPTALNVGVHGKVDRLFVQFGRSRPDVTLAHELVHALIEGRSIRQVVKPHNQQEGAPSQAFTAKENPNEYGTVFRHTQRAGIGLRFNTASDLRRRSRTAELESVRFHWLNEATTTTLGLELVGIEPFSKVYGSYYDERMIYGELLKKIPEQLFLNAKTVTNTTEHPNARETAWRKLSSAVNAAYRPGFLVRLDRYIQKHGSAAGRQLLEANTWEEALFAKQSPTVE